MNKIIHVNNPGNITERQEKAIMNAFERYEGEVEIKVPQKEHLVREFVPGVCCNHLWIPVNVTPTSDPLVPNDNLVWLKKNFEEEEITAASVCTVCGATCLTEGDKIWAYDATCQAFGFPIKKQKERHNARPQKNERKTR